MRTIRRLYFYAVAFISLEVVLWGLISLLRIIVTPDAIGNNATRLAEGLANSPDISLDQSVGTTATFSVAASGR